MHDILKETIWYLDSGCSRHMIGCKSLLNDFQEERGPDVVFEDTNVGKMKGFGILKNGNVMFKKVR